MLTLRDTKFGYDGRVIIGCRTLDMAGGDVVGIVGGNGSGKSTFLKGIVGLAQTIKGKMFFEDACLAGVRTSERIRKGLAFHPQSGKVFGDLSVEDNLRVGFSLRADRSAQFATEKGKALEWLPPLESLLSRLGRHLSGGERQLTGLGRCLMQGPRLLLLDEPSAALDHANKEALSRLVRELATEAGIAVLLAEHDKSVLKSVGARVLSIEGSELRG